MIERRSHCCCRCAQVLPLSLWLKAHTPILSKDVTSVDGWRIEIAVTTPTPATPARRVVVTHVRKEQSLSHEPFEHFQFAYALRFALVGATLEACDAHFTAFDWDATLLAPEARAALTVLDKWNAVNDGLATEPSGASANVAAALATQ